MYISIPTKIWVLNIRGECVPSFVGTLLSKCLRIITQMNNNFMKNSNSVYSQSIYILELGQRYLKSSTAVRTNCYDLEFNFSYSGSIEDDVRERSFLFLPFQSRYLVTLEFATVWGRRYLWMNARYRLLRRWLMYYQLFGLVTHLIASAGDLGFHVLGIDKKGPPSWAHVCDSHTKMPTYVCVYLYEYG